MNARVGFIGLGNIGAPMARTLLRADIPLTVFDSRPEVLSSFANTQAALATSGDELAACCDIICIAVVDDEQVRQLAYGTDFSAGILASCKPGSNVLIHSTVSPGVCQEIASKALARSIAVIDAPVSGASAAAEAGDLTLLIGGDTHVIEECRHVLKALSSRVFHVGDVGMGQVAKLCNNLMFTANLRVAFEALTLADASGLGADKLHAIAAVSTGDSWALQNVDAMLELLNNSKQSVSASKLGDKDLSLALQLARDSGLDMPLTELFCRDIRKDR